MTDLEREAREAAEIAIPRGNDGSISYNMKQTLRRDAFIVGYLAAAEPREKRIKLLEKIIEDMEEDSYDPFPIKGD